MDLVEPSGWVYISLRQGDPKCAPGDAHWGHTHPALRTHPLAGRADGTAQQRRVGVREGGRVCGEKVTSAVTTEPNNNAARSRARPVSFFHSTAPRPSPPRSTGECLRAYFLQVAIVANHQNGRDSHVRQIRVFGPRRDPSGQILTQPLQFTTTEFSQFATVR